MAGEPTLQQPSRPSEPARSSSLADVLASCRSHESQDVVPIALQTVREARVSVRDGPPIQVQGESDRRNLQELRAFVAQVNELEQRVESEIKHATAASSQRLHEHQELCEASTLFEETKASLKDEHPKAVSSYLLSVAQRNSKVAQLRQEKRLRRLQELDFANNKFHWYRRLHQLCIIVQEDAYSSRSRW